MSVLVSYIPTPEGWVALGQAIDEARRRDTDVVVVNVAVGSNFTDVTFADEKDLDGVSARLTELGIQHRIEQVLDGAAVAAEVLRVADEIEAELVVVGLRRRSAVGKAVFGSNAQTIIVEAHCPVLSVRPQ